MSQVVYRCIFTFISLFFRQNVCNFAKKIELGNIFEHLLKTLSCIMKSHNLLFLCLLLLLVSCSDHKKASEMFDSVNTVILANPDSALRMLDSLSSEIDLTDEAMLCHYNLLYIKAKDKAYLPLGGDSVILSILPYFEQHTEHLAEAYCYAGRIYSDMGDSPEALNYFQKSLQLLSNEPLAEADLKIKTVVLSQAGWLFRTQLMNEDSRMYYQQAMGCDSILKDTTNLILDLIDIANSYRDSEVYDSADVYYEKAFSLCTEYKDAVWKSEVYLQKSKQLCDLKQYDEALKCFHKIGNCHSSNPNTYNFVGGWVHYNLGQEDSATIYWNRVLQHGNIYQKVDAYAGMANIAMHRGNIEKATDYINKYLALSDSSNRAKQAEALINIQHLYNYKHKSEEVNELKISIMEKKQGLWMLGSAVATISLVFFCAFHYMRTKQLNADLQLTRYRRLVEKMDAEKENTLTTEIKTHEKIHLSSIVRRVHNLIENGEIMKSDEWKEVEMLIDEVYPTFLRTLYELRFLNKTDLQICKLMKLGFTPNDVSKLIGRDKSTVSASRKKLAQKAFGKGRTSKDWDEYIRSL